MKRIKRVLQVLVSISAACLLFGLFDRWILLADLVCQFRLIISYFLIAASGMLFLFGCWRWASVSMLFGCTFLFLIWPFACPFPLHRTSEETGYTLFSHNVLVSNRNKQQVTSHILANDPDFILLYEIDRVWKEHLLDQLAERWPHYKIESRQDAFGIAIFSKHKFDQVEVIEFPGDNSTPIISAEVELEKGSEAIRIIAAHPVPPIDPTHWRARNRMFQDIANYVRSLDQSRVIVAGDFNCSPWCHSLQQLASIADLRFSTSYRGIQMTWSPFQYVKLGLPIDHILAGREIQVLGYENGRFSGSDHR